MISLSIRRLIGDRRGSVLRDFDANVGATTVTLLNIGNGGVPKKHQRSSGGSIFLLVLGALLFEFWGLTFHTDFCFFFQFLVGAHNIGLFYFPDLFYFVCTGPFCVSFANICFFTSQR
ncbi:hypothetical protein B0H19DRAFT_1172721 [Mycena capillaripes]|nr:hypothetical protein B0H19DRAFT_1172721 [Mycena capillaripes]